MPLDPQKIRARREALNLTQGQLAAAAKMPRPVICRIESGRHGDAKMSTAERLAAALRCDVAEISRPYQPPRHLAEGRRA